MPLSFGKIKCKRWLPQSVQGGTLNPSGMRGDPVVPHWVVRRRTYVLSGVYAARCVRTSRCAPSGVCDSRCVRSRVRARM